MYVADCYQMRYATAGTSISMQHVLMRVYVKLAYACLYVGGVMLSPL